MDKVHGSGTVCEYEIDHRRTKVAFAVAGDLEERILHRQCLVVLAVYNGIAERKFALLPERTEGI